MYRIMRNNKFIKRTIVINKFMEKYSKLNSKNLILYE